MALFNYATKEITLKIVYYGPGLSGKTTNIQYLHSALNAESKGKLLSLSTESDRTLFFDFLPIELGKIKEFSVRFQLYTVPGQVRYNATRKVVLKGADAVVFVADSQRDMREQNIESLENMLENLTSNNINPDEISVVLQYNKRDLTNILTIDELNSDINKNNAFNIIEAEAITGKGVEDTFRLITRLVLKDIARKHKIEIQPVLLKEEVKEVEISEVQKPERESVQLDSEAELVEPAGYALEEELKELAEPGYRLEKAMEAIPTVEKIEPEREPDLITEYAIEKEVDSHETVDIWEARGAPAFSMEAIPTIEKIEPKKEPDLKTEYAIERNVYSQEALEISEPKGAPAVPDESLKINAPDIAELTALISDLKGAIASLKADMHDIKESLRKAEEKAGVREDRNIKEMRKEQREMRSILRDIAVAISELKVKKSWFRF